MSFSSNKALDSVSETSKRQAESLDPFAVEALQLTHD